MAKRTERFRDEGGPSARHLVLMFLAAVAVCAVFFALGFVVGYNRSPSNVSPVTENVTSPSGNIPPTVNSPAGSSSQPGEQGMETENVSPGSASHLMAQHPKPLAPEPVARPKVQAKIQAHAPAAKPVPRKPPKRRAATEKRKPSPSSAAANSSSHFAVQVMASRTRADAVTLDKLLKSHGYPVFILSPQQSSAKDKLYRVQVGPYPSRTAAERIRHELEMEGFKPFITH